MLEALKVLKKYDMKRKGLCNKIEEGEGIRHKGEGVRREG
jgi:hypothetical protein